MTSLKITMSSPAILILGVSRGIGLATLEYLLKSSDAVVYGVSRSPPPQDLLDRYPSRLHFHSADLYDSSSATQIVESMMAHYGRLSGIIYNSGTIEPLCTMADLDHDAFLKCMTLNIGTFIQIVRHALPHLKQTQGRVVGVSSGAAIKGRSGWGAYSMSKAAMNLAIETWASENPEITFVSLRPGVVDTRMQDEIRERGLGPMGSVSHGTFVNLKTNGKLLDPRLPAMSLGQLVLNAPTTLSGRFLQWDDIQVLELV